MSTRGSIAICERMGKGKVKWIYSHWDNYLSCNGALLLLYYRKQSKIEELINTGSISSLKAEIGQKHDFDNPTPGWTIFYGRDRGEDDELTHVQTTDCCKFMVEACEEYIYLFVIEEQKWYYRKDGDNEFSLLTPEACELLLVDEPNTEESFIELMGLDDGYGVILREDGSIIHIDDWMKEQGEWVEKYQLLAGV